MTVQIWIFQEDLTILSKALKDVLFEEEVNVEYSTTPMTTDQICVTLTLDELTVLMDRDVLLLIQAI
jgi:hypothetical protein